MKYNIHMLSGFADQIQKDVLLKSLTTVGIGGLAKQYIRISKPEDLLGVLQASHSQNIPYFLMGGGSNLLVSDDGIDQLVIHNQVSGITSLPGETLEVQSGTMLQDLVDYTIEHGLSGMQKMTGIPGTVGGAVYGNAGAFGQATADCLLEVVAFDGEKEITFSKEECKLSYRTSIFKLNRFPILRVKFQFTPADPNTLHKKAVEIATKRAFSYPKGLMCPGSFFKNILADSLPEQTRQNIPAEKILFGKIPAGYLLEMVGAKGQKLGDIEISPTHANLFINSGEGTAKDFYQLAKTYVEKVKEKFNITLESEVQLINLPALSISIE